MFSDLYEVVRTVEVGKDGLAYRLEVLKDCSSSIPKYTVRFYVEEYAVVAPMFWVNKEKNDNDEMHMGTWLNLTFGLIEQDTIELALAQGLNMLHEQIERQKTA